MSREREQHRRPSSLSPGNHRRPEGLGDS
jgi:hypothetical protein